MTFAKVKIGLRSFMYRFFLGLMLLAVISACLDELDIDTLADDSANGKLVVEAVLTNELKTQQVFLSRTDSRLDLETDTIWDRNIPIGIRPYDSVNVESGAMVRVLGSNGQDFNFTEGREGSYYSDEPFALQTGTDYTLEVTLASGASYVSDNVAVSGTSDITNIYAERTKSELGVDGVAIYVDSKPESGVTEYYRYTYDETYKIVAPYWSPWEFELTNYVPCSNPPTYDLEVVPREVQNQVCYNTVASNGIVQNSTVGNSGTNVSKQMVRFIGKDNYIISHRYSILVKQHVQSAAAYSHYETLKSFSQSEGLFSQIQPGALYANMHRKDGTSEEIFGYVEATSVSERRLFFNFADLFPGEELPPYPYNCGPYTAFEPPPPCGGDASDCPPSVVEGVDQGLITYYAPYDDGVVPVPFCIGPYAFTVPPCGDCTYLGKNVVPDFWVE